jgi:hypothetical protein
LVLEERVLSEVAATLELAVRVGLGLYFGLSGLAKAVSGPDEIAQLIASYHVAPRGYQKQTGFLLVGFELAIAVGLLVYPARIAAVLACILLVVLGAAVSVELWRGRRHPCGCLGTHSVRPIGWTLVAQDALLAVLALSVVIVDGFGQFPIASALLTVSDVDRASVLLSGVALALALVLWDEIEASIAAYQVMRERNDAISRDIELRAHTSAIQLSREVIR